MGGGNVGGGVDVGAGSLQAIAAANMIGTSTVNGTNDPSVLNRYLLTRNIELLLYSKLTGPGFPIMAS